MGQLYTTLYVSRDADGNAVLMNMTGIPEGATFNSVSGNFTWTPISYTPIIGLRLLKFKHNSLHVLQQLCNV